MQCRVAEPISSLVNNLRWQEAQLTHSKLRKIWCLFMFNLLLATSTVVEADGLVINVDSKYNSHYDSQYDSQSNPQYIYLPAGNYSFEYIGPRQGGRHTARNAWRGITMWCIYAHELCELGWQVGVVIYGDSLSIPPKYRPKGLWKEEGFYLCLPDKLLAQRRFERSRMVYASPEAALDSMRKAQDIEGLCSLQLVRPGFLKVFDGDGYHHDNRGGVSIRILTSLPVINFIVDILPGVNSNIIVPSDAGILEVAVLGGDARDVSTIRPETLSLLPDASPLNVRPSPVCTQTTINDDQYPDLLCQFIRDPSEVGPGATRVYLRGLTADGKLIQGRDVVTLRAETRQ
jgi:hypothetical protein